ncbi:MAG: hypothetical protein RIE58_00900 [Vicingaceae bacterium]
MKRISILVISFFVLSFVGKAQDMILTLHYNFGQATGDFEQFTPDPAYRGGGLNFTRFLESNDHIGMGLSIDWVGFYKKTARSTFPYYDEQTGRTNSDINALQVRYLYVTPILASFDYYFIKDANFMPYIGFNVGTIYTEQELNISALSNRVNTAWDFAAGAEAGLHLVFGESGLGMNLTGMYTHSFYNHTFYNVLLNTNTGGIFSVGLGVSFLMLR